jgi:integrase/recombinase XerD
MATTIPSAALVPVAPVFSNTERLALAGFLAGYSGLTREAYELDLRQYTSWCSPAPAAPVRRSPRRHRVLRPRPGSPRPGPRHHHPPACTVAGFYKYAAGEELLDHSPAAHVRRPRLDYESHATGPDRNELGALLVAAGLGPPEEHALISLLALTACGSPKRSAQTSRPWGSSAATARW